VEFRNAALSLRVRLSRQILIRFLKLKFNSVQLGMRKIVVTSLNAKGSLQALFALIQYLYPCLQERDIVGFIEHEFILG
jgi:hypothetical protein